MPKTEITVVKAHFAQNNGKIILKTSLEAPIFLLLDKGLENSKGVFERLAAGKYRIKISNEKESEIVSCTIQGVCSPLQAAYLSNLRLYGNYVRACKSTISPRKKNVTLLNGEKEQVEACIGMSAVLKWRESRDFRDLELSTLKEGRENSAHRFEHNLEQLADGGLVLTKEITLEGKIVRVEKTTLLPSIQANKILLDRRDKEQDREAQSNGDKGKVSGADYFSTLGLLPPYEGKEWQGD